MANPNSCTHIKVSGVRCGAPALRGEQFCYFHQHAHRGVRRPPRSRLHSIAIVEDHDSIQASIMEVIDGLVRDRLDVKRAELILRALHIAYKNARHIQFGAFKAVKEIPNYPEPAPPEAETLAEHDADRDLPFTAAAPMQSYQQQQAASRKWARISARAEEQRQREAVIRANLDRARIHPPDEPVSVPTHLGSTEDSWDTCGTQEAEMETSSALKPAHANVGADAPARPGREATVPAADVTTKFAQPPTSAPSQSPKPSQTAKPSDPEPSHRKPPLGVKNLESEKVGPNRKKMAAAATTKPAPKERKNAAQRASAG
ncbi:MAG TPA: hypothetical protein VGS27_36165 [Candidatus Sulfotelmatobacter sp.]|nr:hypothetical protein [Candidatus Sulfotelmatobacter sp.]